MLPLVLSATSLKNPTSPLALKAVVVNSIPKRLAVFLASSDGLIRDVITLLRAMVALEVSIPPFVYAATVPVNSLKFTPALEAIALVLPKKSASSPKVVCPSLTATNKLSEAS